MSIGERIRYIRNLRGMTQKELGKAIGFDDRTADIRIAQYESGTRTPKANYVEAIAKALNVSELCLTLDKHNKSYVTMFEMLNDWRNQAEKLKNDEISEEEYSDWKYNYPPTHENNPSRMN